MTHIRLIPFSLIAATLCIACVDGHTACAQPVAKPTAEQAIESGREALSSRWDFPWYDAEADTLTHVKVKPPPPPQQTQSGSSLLSGLISWLGWITLGLLLATIAAMLVLAFWRREVAEVGHIVAPANADSLPTSPDRVEALPEGAQVAVDDLLAAARESYHQGDFARAIVLLFSHRLVELDKRHWICLARGKTNRQYLREMGRRGATRSRLQPLVERTMVLFERTLFGRRSPTREEFDLCWSHNDEFRELLQQPMEALA